METSFWQKNDRWYRFEIGFDLLGDLVFVRAWGSLNAKSAGRVIIKTLSRLDAEKIDVIKYRSAQKRKRSSRTVQRDLNDIRVNLI